MRPAEIQGLLGESEWKLKASAIGNEGELGRGKKNGDKTWGY